jgi:hypothetical protein
MPKTRIFISSVEAEFAKGIQMLFEYILSDPLLGIIFDTFLFKRLGNGTADIIRITRENNLQKPNFEQKEEFKAILYRPSTAVLP